MVDSNFIAVKLNIPEWNLSEVWPFLQDREEGYTTIFNVLSEPERYQQDLEAVERARDGGATGVLSVEQENFDDYYYAVFPTEQQADKFARKREPIKLTLSNITTT